MWNDNWTIVICIFALYLIRTPLAQDDESYDGATTYTDKHSCESKESCSSCIQTNGCAWCSKPENVSDSSTHVVRCKLYSDQERKDNTNSGRLERDADSNTWCPPEHILTVKSTLEIIKNAPLQRASKQNEKEARDAVQIMPQEIKLRLRVNETYEIKLQYAQAEDYPVDLYYLMDLSASMADDKESLSKLGDQLAKEMMNLTGNFRLGFGSFVDKIEMPFVSTVPAKLKQPCDVPTTKEPCAPPYGFINNMPLNSDTKQFKEEVKKAKVSGNLDSPEGGLDALMQVIVCGQKIGWREKARRLIIMSTDAVFHLAGDGKLAGIVEPNDGQCHLNENMTYTHGEILDYPSISQINAKAQEHNMILIFAVTDKQIKVYEELAHRISGASSGKLTKDSSNIVKLVSQQYVKLVQAVTLTDDAENHVEVRYFSSCLNKGAPEKETKECGGLRVGNKIDFKARIRVLRCPEDEAGRNMVFNIKPQGLSETLKVHLEIICDCPCESPGNPGYEEKSKACSEAGVLKCGVCFCDEGRVGKQCHCDSGKTSGSDIDDVSGCVPGGNSSDPGVPICSNLGTCKCGVCECKTRDNPQEIITGKYCECDNYSCKRHGGKLCSGPEHGTCKCSECDCNTGWKGPACECKDSKESCIKPGSSSGESEVCSGHGECICGLCKCEVSNSTRYSGKYCEECPTCKGRCQELKHCVECQVFGSSSSMLSELECSKCHFKPKVVEKFSSDKTSDENDNIGDMDVNDESEDGQRRRCSLPDKADCTFFFEYWYDKDKNLQVEALQNKQCAPPVDILGIVLSVIGSIVLAGLVLLLVWKLLTTLHDRREFVRFEKERQMAKWGNDENPLYKTATSSFVNPTFGK